MVEAFRTPAGWDTTSEPRGRNALPGAPVKAFGQLEKSLSFRSSGSSAPMPHCRNREIYKVFRRFLPFAL